MLTRWIDLYRFCLLGILLCLVFGPRLASGDDVAAPDAVARVNPLDAAIRIAQLRSVKVYGAKLGREAGYSTGMVVSPQGEIVTASGPLLATEGLRIVGADGQEHSAKVIKRNLPWQLALLKIEAATPVYFDLEHRAEVDAGDWAVVISNAFRVGEGNEPLGVTLGVVSAKQKLDAKRGLMGVTVPGEVYLLDAITSNPGAAGGPVLSPDGKLIGMVGKLLEDKNSGARVNYAIPREQLFSFLKEVPAEELVEGAVVPANPKESPGGKRELGIRLLAVGGARGAAYVDRVVAGSEAAMAGVRPDDLIVSINGRTVRDSAAFKKIVAELQGAEVIVIEVKRKEQLLKLELLPKKPEVPNAAEDAQ